MLFVSDLTAENIKELSFKFIYNLHKLVEESKINNIKSSDVWEKMNTKYDKDTVLPRLVHSLIKTEHITPGNNADEVKLVYQKLRKKYIPSLDLFNNIVNESEKVSIPVILNLNGTIISGKLISIRRYYDLLQKSFIKNFSGQNQKKWNDIFNDLKNELPNTPEENEVTSDITGRNSICLEDPKYLVNGQLIKAGDSSLVWIGKIEDINGFTLGKLEFPTEYPTN